jgi:hypothetical protein
MKSANSRTALLACAAALATAALSAPADNTDRPSRIYVTAAASSLVDQGLAEAAPADSAAFQTVPTPAVRFQTNEAQATTSPWIDSNAWRFQRGISKANYAKLAPGSASLAAAEAFAFNVDAILNPDPADLEPLGRMLRFLKAQQHPPMPAMANIAVVDDHSPAMDEVLNMLTRRNLLYRVVSAPDRKLDLTVQLGTKDFPTEATANPSDFAARVREKLGDDKRLVRLYGTSTVIARLTGDGTHARLYLLSYSRSRGQQGSNQQIGNQPAGIRIRVLGRHRPAQFAAYGAPADAKLSDVENPGNATEFTLPAFNTLAIIDLDAVK